jgi:hypothetical protein
MEEVLPHPYSTDRGGNNNWANPHTLLMHGEASLGEEHRPRGQRSAKVFCGGIVLSFGFLIPRKHENTNDY